MIHTDLPSDAWWHVFDNLTKEELVNVSSVSHACVRACDADPRWKKFVQERDGATSSTHSWKEKAFTYCRRYDEVLFRILNARFVREDLGDVPIPLGMRKNLWSVKRCLTNCVGYRDVANMTSELQSRLENCLLHGDPLPFDDIHVLLEAGAELDSEILSLLSSLLERAGNFDVAQKKLNAILDQVRHPGSRLYRVSYQDVLRVLERLRRRLPDMSEWALSELTLQIRAWVSNRRHVDLLKYVPVNFPRYRKLVITLCGREPSAIRYVPEDLDDYLGLVLDSMVKSPSLFYHLRDDVQTSRTFLRQAVLRNGHVLLRYASTHEPARAMSDPAFYRELVMVASLKNQYIWEHIVWDAISDYQEFVTSALDTMIQQNRLDDIPFLLRNIDPTRVDNYQPLVEKAVLEAPWAICGVKEQSVDNYRELLNNAAARDVTILCHPCTQDHFGLEEYTACVTKALQSGEITILDLDRDRLDHEYYRTLVITGLRKDGMLLDGLPMKCAKDPEIVAAAVQQNPRAITYACDEFKKDLTPLLRACADYREAERLFLARWCLKKKLTPYDVDRGFALIVQMAAEAGNCPKGEVERLLGRIRDSTLREEVRQTLGLVKEFLYESLGL